MRLRPPPPEHYDALAESLLAGRKRPPDPEAIAAAAERLDAMLTHTIERIDAVEAKAGLVPAAVAGVVALLVGRVAKDLPAGTVLVGILAVVAAIVATLLALWAREPVRMKSGPNPLAIARATGDDPLPRDQGIVNSLAVSAENAEDVLDAKADRFTLAIAVGAIGILLVAIFGALGGIR